MPFSLSLLILVIFIEYLAFKKEKQNEQKRRCNHKFGDRDTSSKITHI